MKGKSSIQSIPNHIDGDHTDEADNDNDDKNDEYAQNEPGESKRNSPLAAHACK